MPSFFEALSLALFSSVQLCWRDGIPDYSKRHKTRTEIQERS